MKRFYWHPDLMGWYSAEGESPRLDLPMFQSGNKRSWLAVPGNIELLWEQLRAPNYWGKWTHFAEKHGIPYATLCKWRKALLKPKP